MDVLSKLMPFVDYKALERLRQIMYKLPSDIQKKSSLCIFFIQSLNTIIERTRQSPDFVYAPVEGVINEDFIKGFSQRATELGADGLDIVEMLEIMRDEHKRFTSLDQEHV